MEEYLGAIKSFAFNFAPAEWELCNGDLLSIANNQALYSLLGTTYGGNGTTTFALPELRGRSIVHPGYGPGLSPVVWGEKSGLQKVTLTHTTMPYHSHLVVSGTGDNMISVETETKINVASGVVLNEPDNGTYPFGSGGSVPNLYTEAATGTDRIGGVYSQSIVNGTTTSIGGNAPVNIKQPYVGVYFCICVQGIYPSRN